MKSLLPISVLYYKYLINKKSFIICSIILIIIGLFLIPSQNSDYVTFYIGKVSPIPNKYWIGYLSSIFSNFIISFLILFMIIGEKEKEILNFTYTQIDTSKLSSFYKALHKIIGLFFIGISFLFILNITIIILNFDKINLPLFTLPLVYFCIPYIFIVSSLSYFIEFYQAKKLKILIYFTLIFIIVLNDKYVLDMFGLNELNILINKTYGLSNKFAIGYLKKTNSLSIINVTTVLYPIFLYKKIILIVICLLIIYFLSKINISRNVDSNINVIDASIDKREVNLLKTKTKILTSNNFVFSNLLIKDFYSFMLSVSKLNILLISFLWLPLFVVNDNFIKMLLPILFLLTLFINNFLSILYQNNLEYSEKTSAFRSYEIISSKFIIILIFYILLLVPILIKSTSTSILKIFIGFLLLSALQVLLVRFSKNNILMDIILIILYATYLFGTPIINIFQL